MNNHFIPVNEPLLSGNERKYLVECIDTGWISSEGTFVRRFEEAFSRRVQRRHGVAVSSGSAALDISVKALGIGPGDEVILPTFTIISPAASILRGGATPVLTPGELKALGFQVAIFPASGFLAATEALSRVYAALHETGASTANGAPLTDFKDFLALMGFDEVLDFESRYD